MTIYNEFFNTVDEIRTYNLAAPVDGDLLFVTVDRTSMFFGHMACGIFRLKSGFSTSGKSDDGVFVLVSQVISDWYWERVCKGVPRVASTGVVTLTQNQTVILDHEADAGGNRYPQVYEITAQAASALLDKDSPMTVSSVGATKKTVPVDAVHQAPGLSLARRYQLVVDQTLNHAYTGNPAGQNHAYHKDGKLHITADNGSVIYSYGANWSLESYTTGQNSAVFNSCIGTKGLRRTSWNSIIVVYSLQGGEWVESDLLTEGPYEQHNTDAYTSGMAGATFYLNGDVIGSVDRPPFGLWETYYPAAEDIIRFESPGYAEGDYYYGCGTFGYIVEWTGAPNTMVRHTYETTDYQNQRVAYKSDGEAISWSIDDYVQFHPGERSDVYFGVSPNYPKIIIFGGGWEQNALATFSISGGEATSGYDAQLPFFKVMSTNGDGAENYFLAAQQLGIIDDGYFFNDAHSGILCREVAGYAGYVCHARDLEDPSGIRDGQLEYQGFKSYNRLTPLPGNQFYMNSGNTAGLGWIVSLNVLDEYEDAYITFEDPLDIPEEITSVAITCNEPADTAIHFLLQDSNGGLWKWGGANWVAAVDYYDGNTKAEWESSAVWSQASVDIGSLDGLGFVATLQSVTGTATPVLTDLTVNYSKGEEIKLASEYTQYQPNLAEVTIVSDTQTQLKNIQAATTKYVMKVFFMD